MIRTGGPRTARRDPSHLPSELAAALGAPVGASPPASVVGLEHEYSPSVSGNPLDFRDVIHELDIPGRRLDPGDLNAYRCPSGLVVTCDAADAEVVSPPLPVRPGFTMELAAWAEHGRAELLRLLPPGFTVTPFSTHLSASMPDDVVEAACELFAHTFAPALMLMLDGADSHGVFVRPRSGRLELCGEHAMGVRLGAAAALVAGGIRACAAALGARGEGHLPPLLAVDVRPASGRHGLFVGRHLAFGNDLYAAGRQAPLPLLAGGVMAVQEHLVLAWESARAALGADAGDADFRFGDAMVSGRATLGVEAPGDDDVPGPSPAPPAPSPFGAVLEPRRRPAFEAAPVAATWDFTVFRLTGLARQAYACVPGPQLGTFLARLDAGLLDPVLGRFLDAVPTGRVLSAHDETAQAELWDEAVIGPDLLAYERSTAAGDRAGLRLPPLAPPPAYVRSGKATVVVPPPALLRHQPISAAASGTAIAHAQAAPREAVSPQPPSVPPGPRPVEAPRASPPSPAGGPGRRRRRVGVLVGAFSALLIIASAAAMTGMFVGGKPAGVDILTSPDTPSTLSDVTIEPSNTSPLEPTTMPSFDAVPPPPTMAVGVPSPAVENPPTTTRPTSTVTVPATTRPIVTTAPVDTAVPSTVTTVSIPPATHFVVAVTSGILGCAFQPPSASAVAGSTVRFRNDMGGAVVISVTPPADAGTSINLDAGGTSGAYPLPTPGSYAVSCTQGGDSLGGRMTITVTSP